MESIRNGAGGFCKEKLYNCQIYDGETLVRNFIPCYCMETVLNVEQKQCQAGTVGLYDLVDGKFYTNQNLDNNTDFEKGEDL